MKYTMMARIKTEGFHVMVLVETMYFMGATVVKDCGGYKSGKWSI
jgi:hypothetical protein